MVDTRPTRRAALDPDALAALEEERDFLLRSLADLERERAAGDVDDADYAALQDDYTARAAAVLRSIEQRRTAIAAAAPKPSTSRRLVWIAVVVLFAVVSGALIARASGSRGSGDTATGDPLRDTRQYLSDAQQAAVAGKYDDSIELYTKALAIQPGNVEALTYRAWSKVRGGDPAAAAVDLDAAIDLDATYPDARVFRASVYVSAGDFAAAAAQLKVFDTLRAPDLMNQILASQRLRERVALGLVRPVFLVSTPPPLAGSGFTADDLFLAAQQLDVEQTVQDEIKLYDIMLAANADDRRAITYRAWVVARVGVGQKQTTIITTAVRDLDRVIAADATYPDARVFRAFTLHFGLSRTAEAKADLAAFDALAAKPAGLVALIDEYGLRAALGVAAPATGTTAGPASTGSTGTR